MYFKFSFRKNNGRLAISYWDYGSGTSIRVDPRNRYGSVFSGGSAMGYLTGGQKGKTWVLDMSHPKGWYSLGYLQNPTGPDEYYYHPYYKDATWSTQKIE